MILTFLLLFFLTLSYISYRIAFHVPDGYQENIYDLPQGEQYESSHELMTELIREMDSIPFEPVFITSHDGLKLAARYYHVSDTAPLQIQFHGYRGSAIRDFCGGNKLAREMGQNTLVVDQRAHGKSEGNTITFGIRERFDCLAWVQYAADRFGSQTPIILAGVSMGAATVLMASELKLPGNVKCIIADCPFTSPEDIILKVGEENMHLPPFLARPFLRCGAALFGHFRLTESSARKAVQNTQIPILLIHGSDDRFVPCSMSRELYASCTSSQKHLELFDDAAHGISYLLDPEKYAAVTNAFLEDILRQDNCPSAEKNI